MRWLRRGVLALAAITIVALAALAILLLVTPQRLPALLSPWPGPGRPGSYDAPLPSRTLPPVQKATRHWLGAIPAHLSCAGLDAAAFEEAVGRVDARMSELAARWSRYRSDSQVSRLNDASGDAVEVDPETAALLRAARSFGEATGGALDVTVLPVVQLWKEAEQRDRLPTADETAAALTRVGPAGWNLEGHTVHRHPGVRFDLNAIAEGAMADAALALLRDAGCHRAIVELGGDIALHRAPGEPPFRIGVDDPADPSRLLARVEVEAGAIDTAGDYQRFYTIGGQRYGHIVDPRTGAPVLPDLWSVTVVAPDALTADAWDTALFVLGWEGARAAVEARPELEALLVHHDGRRWVSSGLEGKVTFVQGDQKR